MTVDRAVARALVVGRARVRAVASAVTAYGFLVLFPERSKFRTAELPGFCFILAK